MGFSVTIINNHALCVIFTTGDARCNFQLTSESKIENNKNKKNCQIKILPKALDKRVRHRSDLLQIMDLPQPKEMTGESLLVKKA